MQDTTPIIHFGSFLPITTMILQSLPMKEKSSSVGGKASKIEDFNQLRQVLNGDARLLILDLEFYQDQKKHKNCVAQIAGRMFEGHSSFNYHLYANNMPADRQLSFLQQYDLRFSEAATYSIEQIFQRIFNFIDIEQPDYIVSWDNSTDFELLNREANRLKLAKDERPWRTIQSLDLERLVAKEVWKNKSGISLEKMCRLLHFPPVKYHQAQNDVVAIEQILKFYARDLWRELNCY
ncbi:hypothetical protein [Limosilactobacillus caviae]|uniref:Exonuclease domain-containing protein n=1 Tax=Limosilactobacillus caviae TaxID=1769424 RepID=A0ABQ2C689_9LACO|nr:hypothetical protein [Limosilactobacillus caviae]MCD7124252.1 hypothetical protein [Limosilactobacillus caviae]MRH46744.1 hypothetical protein [Limosilactobacillus reuteri]GGI63888.1 hypothetical protein GCM10011459_17220 [Limosilactobacillus caviae]